MIQSHLVEKLDQTCIPYSDLMRKVEMNTTEGSEMCNTFSDVSNSYISDVAGTNRDLLVLQCLKL